MTPEIIENSIARDRDPKNVIQLKLGEAFICGNVECNTISNCDVCPSCTSQTMPFRPHRSTALAHEIAERAAYCDIDSFTVSVEIDGVSWNDTSLELDSSEREDVDQSVEYLDAIGVLIHHPAMPHVVRWED